MLKQSSEPIHLRHPFCHSYIFDRSLVEVLGTKFLCCPADRGGAATITTLQCFTEIAQMDAETGVWPSSPHSALIEQEHKAWVAA